MSGERKRTMKWASARSKELWNGADPQAENLLRDKCRWEHMTRTGVLIEWGDPVTWPGYVRATSTPANHAANQSPEEP